MRRNIPRDEAAHHRHVRQRGKSLVDAGVGGGKVDHVFAVLLHGGNEVARVEMTRTVNEGGHDERRDALAVGHNGIGRFARQVLKEAHPLQNAAQFFEMCLHLSKKFSPLGGSDECIHHLFVALAQRFQLFDISEVAGLGFLRKADELVGHSSQGRNHHDDGCFGSFNNALYAQ